MEIKDVFLGTIDSTNAYAKKNIDSFDKDKITCITAEEQTQGKGRCNRHWISPKGQNIYTTFYFTLPKDICHLQTIAQIMCISLANVLINEGLSPQIKWPNDILLSGKKIAGVFCETIFQEDIIDVFLGIGINIDTENTLLEAIDQPASSLKKESNKSYEKQHILHALQTEFSKNLQIFKDKGFYYFHNEFENLLANKGQPICCNDGKKEYKGILHSISCEGNLNIYDQEKDEMTTIISGDVCFCKKNKNP